MNTSDEMTTVGAAATIALAREVIGELMVRSNLHRSDCLVNKSVHNPCTCDGATFADSVGAALRLCDEYLSVGDDRTAEESAEASLLVWVSSSLRRVIGRGGIHEEWCMSRNGRSYGCNCDAPVVMGGLKRLLGVLEKRVTLPFPPSLPITAVKYELATWESEMLTVYIEQRKGTAGVRWAIVDNRRNCLGKTPDELGFFVMFDEPIPSSRTDEWLDEHRWDSAREAYEFWRANRTRMALLRDELAAYIVAWREHNRQMEGIEYVEVGQTAVSE